MLRLTVLLVALVAIWVGGSWIAAVVRERGDQPLPPAEGRLVPTNDGAVFAQIRGPERGRPVILIHGSAAWSGFWDDIAKRLASDGFKTIAIDLPPFGYSERSSHGAYLRSDQAQRLAGLVRSLHLQDTLIVGHSFGAGATVESVMQNPALFKGMVLISGALGLPPDGQAYPEDSRLLRWAMSQPWLMRTLTTSLVTNPLLTRHFLASFLYEKDAATKEQADILKQPYSRPGTTEAYAQWLPTLLLADRHALSGNPANYASIRLPTSLIWGDRDEVTPLEQGERLNRLIPNSKLSILDNVGHIPHIEAPDRLYGLLLGDLRAISDQGSQIR